MGDNSAGNAKPLMSSQEYWELVARYPNSGVAVVRALLLAKRKSIRKKTPTLALDFLIDFAFLQCESRPVHKQRLVRILMRLASTVPPVR